MNYAMALANARMQLVNDLVAGLTPSPSSGVAAQGKLVIGTVALDGALGVLATIMLQATPFGDPSGGVITLAGVPLVSTASDTGDAAKAELRDTADTVIVGGLTVGTVGTDIIIAAIDIHAGETVTVVSGTITHG